MASTHEHIEPINGDFAGKSIVSIDQFSVDDAEQVMREADGMAQLVFEQGRGTLLQDVIVANLFYEPSTRTFLSFETAAKRLGAETIATQGVEYSSISKGESLRDTIRTVDRYADIIDMRHSDEGAAAIAGQVARVPVINGGDGAGEHPTQALLDLYTISRNLGTLEDLTVSMVGDLKNGRTVHSLARLLAKHRVKLNYVSPRELAMPEGLREQLADEGARQYETHDLHEVIGDSDVVYMTRIQKERFEIKAGGVLYEDVKDAYVVDAAILKRAKAEMMLMHPLPRLNEIHPGVDSDPRAFYFEQVESGMYIRMALLALVLGRSIHSNGQYEPVRRTMKPWMMSGKIS